MTQAQYIHVIETELQKLNEKIDLKIVYGESYSNDARRHRMLQERAREMKRKKYNNFILKLISPFYRHA